MSELHSGKTSLRNRFANAVGSFYEKNEDWFNKNPKVGMSLNMTFVGATIAYNLVRFPDRALRSMIWWARAPLEDFEPNHDRRFFSAPEAPYWQDLVFGEGRLEKLLKRLEVQPQANSRVQKICLYNSEGGLSVLPGHRELVKYGLNDVDIAQALRCVSSRVSSLVLHKERYAEHGLNVTFDQDVSLIMNNTGLYVANEGKMPIISPGGKSQYVEMSLTGLINSYRATGYKDDQAIEIANKTAQNIYIWLLEDVLPVIPNIFYAHYKAGYKAEPLPDGSFRLDRLPKGYDLKDHDAKGYGCSERQRHENKKSIFEIFADGYKGTLPVYPKLQSATHSVNISPV